MRTILATDIGGTKTLFQLSTEDGDVVLEKSYESQGFADFDSVLAAFLNEPSVNNYQINSACFAVAGPVSGRQAQVTNLPWQLDADDLAAKFAINHIVLCNDFEAVAHGINCLDDNDIICLQKGGEINDAPRAVIGAGTGLGQALMLPANDGIWQVVATEGGHTDFGPRDQLQISLLEHLMIKLDHISYERLVSGPGIVEIYQFLMIHEDDDENEQLRLAMEEGDPAAAISHFAAIKQDVLAVKTMDLFSKIYAAQAANFALAVLPYSGLYIAGGIASKNVKLFQQQAFLQSFLDKGKMSSLLTKIPIMLILEAKVGLLGARLLARQSQV